MASRLDRWLRRLDAAPVASSAAVGAAVGGAAGAALLWEPTLPRAAAAGLVALAAIPLARAARAAMDEAPMRRVRGTNQSTPPREAPVFDKPTPIPVDRAPEPEQPSSVPSRPPPPPPARIPDPLPPSLLDMVELPGGTFWMGSRDDDRYGYPNEKPRHRLQVSAFAIGRYPVTQADYMAVMGERRGKPLGDELPVNGVSWFDAVNFCNRLSAREGLQAAYVMGGEQVTRDAEADGYRLPTEAEWEYAARAGTETAWSFGDDEGQLGEHAWYTANAGRRVQPVGKKKPNPFGLHDMHGNVWEWCWDWFGTYVTSDTDSDTASFHPVGPPVGGLRVLRGGSWNAGPRLLRSAYRVRNVPSLRDSSIGFRCVRGMVRQHGR